MSHDHHHPPSGSHDNEDECQSPHAMTFHAGVCQEILFTSWKTTNAGQLFGACVAVFVAAVAYEGLKYLRENLLMRGASRQLATNSQINIAKNECGQNAPCNQQKTVKQTLWSVSHLMQTLMHLLQSTVSYLLMLVFMTYNVYVCLALILGLVLGYFLFGWQKQTVIDITEHCH